MKNNRLSISFNSPVVLSFSFICFVVYFFDMFFQLNIVNCYFSVFRSSFSNPLTYVRMFTHVLGHENWNHIFNNLSFILILGPLLEEKYGSLDVIFVMLITAFFTALVSLSFFPKIRLLGASGIVFAFILLSSFTFSKRNSLPVTFILVSIMYMGKELYSAIFISDNVSNLSHLIGGLIGSVSGFILKKRNS